MHIHEEQMDTLRSAKCFALKQHYADERLILSNI